MLMTCQYILHEMLAKVCVPQRDQNSKTGTTSSTTSSWSSDNNQAETQLTEVAAGHHILPVGREVRPQLTFLLNILFHMNVGHNKL